MWTLVIGTMVFVLPGAWAVPRARAELIRNGRISTPTFLAAFVAHVGHGAVTIVAAIQQAWPMPVPTSVSFSLGFSAFLVGVALIVSAQALVSVLSADLGIDHRPIGDFRYVWD